VNVSPAKMGAPAGTIKVWLSNKVGHRPPGPILDALTGTINYQYDANGNLTLRPQGGFRGGGADGATGGTGATSGTPPSTIDRTAFQKARDACGQPPQGAFGGFNRQNSQEFQDAALKFAKCMRSKGIDVPDPDFSGTDTPGAGGPNANGRRGLFGSLDRNDPKVQQAFDACRSNLPQRPGGGGPGGATTPTTTSKST
jgi:hypothetical protein